MTHHHTVNDHPAEDRFMRLPQVLSRSGMSKSTVYQRIREGKFPSPTKLGPRTSVWRASAISAWIDAQGQA